MPQDVRRSDHPEEPAEKGGFARSLFRFGGKRDKRAEPGRLQDRLKEVLERDRALISSGPPVSELAQDGVAHDGVAVHDDEVWPDPFGASDPEPHTGTRTAELAWAAHDLDEPFAQPAGSSVPPPEERELRLSQIASWIEEEITELADDAGPLALEAPLNDDEAAELDAVLGSSETVMEEGEASTGDETLIEPTLNLEAAVAATPSMQAPAPPAADEPSQARAPSSRAQVKAKVSARPAPREDAASKEPITTLTMARLFAMQGYKPRALAVYRELLKRTPDDEALRAELEALEKSE